MAWKITKSNQSKHCSYYEGNGGAHGGAPALHLNAFLACLLITFVIIWSSFSNFDSNARSSAQVGQLQ